MPEEARRIRVRALGEVSYGESLKLQDELVERRRGGEIPDQLLLLEHPHVITRGSSTRHEHLLHPPDVLRARGVEVFDSGRGGDVTYHGPGQLVGYPILDLKPDRKDLHAYLRDLETVLIRTLATFGIDAGREEGLTGVWVPEGKVAAIGVRVSSGWITSHGFALNVNTDLSRFSSIVPCGIQDRSVTSMSRILERPVAVDDVVSPVVDAFGDVFQREILVV
jgi:lipoyl(octanoyl) transferase